uniref:Uncharacterized protein n=1 Tax=Kwoniella bestiolae CBS 10118 TaxID=1296100 RepID=A0A1B9GA84_9TREE|nr:hypothetical protein I302_02785 [Kwoniella bestiolae CBS 10118]OCF27935.1 hypothetical protein I302_02785 [Kwoniella bestiolae CBS 10118]
MSSVTALQPGDVPVNVAVRMEKLTTFWLECSGELKHFYEKDAIDYYKKRAEVAEAELELAKRQDIESDSYPVSNDGSGLKAFKGAGTA